MIFSYARIFVRAKIGNKKTAFGVTHVYTENNNEYRLKKFYLVKIKWMSGIKCRNTRVRFQ